jgi:Flp pilus assembly protein TadG
MRRRFGVESGQGLVEFAISITIFLTLLIGIVDMARGVYVFNGVSEAAREITRETSVHRGSGALGASPETVAMVSTQRALVPELVVTSYACLDLAGNPVTGICQPGDWVRVSVQAPFRPVLPVLTAFGPIVLTSVSSAEVQ